MYLFVNVKHVYISYFPNNSGTSNNQAYMHVWNQMSRTRYYNSIQLQMQINKRKKKEP